MGKCSTCGNYIHDGGVQLYSLGRSITGAIIDIEVAISTITEFNDAGDIHFDFIKSLRESLRPLHQGLLDVSTKIRKAEKEERKHERKTDDETNG